MLSEIKLDVQYELFHRHDMFRHLTDIETRELYAISRYKKVSKPGIIYSHLNNLDKMYFLIQGRIKIAYCMDKDVEVLSEILKEGDIFGALTLEVSSNSNGEFAQVLSDDAIICSFNLIEFACMLKKNSNLNLAFSKMVAGKLKTISTRYCDLVFKDARARVLNFFVLLAKYEGKWTGDKAEINMFCTHQDIANFTASTRQTVSTIINTLKKEQIIIYEGRSRVIIPDMKVLCEGSLS